MVNPVENVLYLPDRIVLQPKTDVRAPVHQPRKAAFNCGGWLWNPTAQNSP